MLGTYHHYDPQGLRSTPFKHPREIVAPPEGLHWVHVPLKKEHLKKEETKDLQRAFDIDRLTWEDITKGDHLPKLEVEKGRIFMILQVLSFDEALQQIDKAQVSLLIQGNWVYTFEHGEAGVFEVVLEKLSANRNGMRSRGMDYLLYSLMGAVINRHFKIFEQVESRMDAIEAQVMRQSKSNPIHDLYRLRKEIMKIKSALGPMKDMIRTLLYETTFIEADDRAVYLDLNDRLIEIGESLAYYRELVNALYDMHLSNASHRMNRIMTTLTVYSAIFIPLTFLAGVYGMNFKYMPELNWPLGYPMFLLICLALSLSMVSYFRRKKWL